MMLLRAWGFASAATASRPSSSDHAVTAAAAPASPPTRDATPLPTQQPSFSSPSPPSPPPPPAMSSGGDQYTVSATPQQHLVYTNHVYLGDDASNARVLTKRPGQPDTYVLVNGCFIYVARAHKSVGPGEIGLSSIQRETLRVSTAQQTTVAPWSLPVNGSADLVTLRLEVELIGTKKATVAGAELSPVLVKQFVGQVFTRGQVFCTDFQGTALKFTVVHGEAGVPVEEQDKKLRHAQEHKGESDEEVRGDGQTIELQNRGAAAFL